MNRDDLHLAAGAVEILLVEDNPGDVLLTEEALQEGKISNRLHVVGDGAEALEFLRNEGKHRDAPVPDLVLLDLNLPKMSGSEVLATMKEDPRLRRIPVVVLTTSKAEEDVCRSYDLHANCYVTKPVDFDRFATVIRSVEEFWISIVRLPRADRLPRPAET
jgi:chemotaxis family two-component system response regulator Rcp1